MKANERRSAVQLSKHARATKKWIKETKQVPFFGVARTSRVKSSVLYFLFKRRKRARAHASKHGAKERERERARAKTPSYSADVKERLKKIFGEKYAER